MNDSLHNRRLTMVARIGRNALLIMMFSTPMILPLIF